MGLAYATANGLKTVMSARDILELTTEDVDAIEVEVEDIQTALDYIDGIASADDLEDGGKHVAFVVEERLKWAESFVNSYAGKVHSLPVRALDGSVPMELSSVTLSLARYKLYSRRVMMQDDVKIEYDNAVAWLKSLSAGSVVLNLGSAGTTVAPEKAKAGFTDRSGVEFSVSFP